ADEARHLDVIRADAVVAAAQRVDAPDVEDVRPDAPYVGAEGDEEAAEILDVGLAGRGAEDGLAVREDGRRDRVLRPHHRRLVQVHARSREALRRQLVDAVEGDVRAERGEGVDVGVETPPSDDVPARPWDGDASEPGEQRAGEEERRTDLATELGIEV